MDGRKELHTLMFKPRIIVLLSEALAALVFPVLQFEQAVSGGK